MPFPAPGHYFPTKDEMADYLESYAEHFGLPVRTSVRVDRLARDGNGFLITAGDLQFAADNVVVAMSNYQQPRVPPYAGDLDPDIVQLHSSEYRNPFQLRDGGVLIVGAGNSGAEIAFEVARDHPTWVAGRDTGQVPFNIAGTAGRLILVQLVLRFLFHRVLTVSTPIGRKARPKLLSTGGPLIRLKRKHLAEAGVNRVAPKVIGVRDGFPLLEDGTVLDVANVIWSTGFHHGFSWIDLPIIGEKEPLHERGIVPTEPGLYFVGLHFLYSFSSVMIHGVGRDAERIATQIAARTAVGKDQIRDAVKDPQPV
jgi:putative flavoprotein involved in K+ transport